MANFIFIGVPYWTGSKEDYTGSVEVIKKSGIADEYGAAWVTIQPDFSKFKDGITAVNHALAVAIRAYPHKTPVIMAGDCTSCLGAVKGLDRKHPAVIWLDAHGDFNTPETTPSNFAGGMPLAAMVGRGNQYWLDPIDLKPVPEKNIIVSDVRDLDPAEGDMLRESDITIVDSMKALQTAPLPDKPIYLHFDTDVVNTDEMPSISYPAEGGPTLADTVVAVRRIVREGEIAGVLFTLWNNGLPGADKAQDSTMQVLRAVLEELSG